MAAAKTPYIVRQGDYLAKLAFVKGFDADEVWNDPANEELKKRRGDADILAPGDILYVPDKQAEEAPIQKGQENSYAASVPKIKVKLQLQSSGEPLAGKAYHIEGLGDEVKGSTEGDGGVSFEAPVTIREVALVLDESGTRYEIRIGDLDPHDELSGIRTRLAHLGYMEQIDGRGDYDEDALKHIAALALSAFQSAQGIDVTGQPDDATLAALVKAHGS
jgi:hypothetical protein